MSLTKGDFSQDWKIATVRPLLKKKPELGAYTQKLQTSLKPVLSLKTATVMHVATVIGPLHSMRSHTRLPICLQEELQYRNKLNKITNDILLRFENKNYHINSNSGPITCI